MLEQITAAKTIVQREKLQEKYGKYFIVSYVNGLLDEKLLKI